VSDSPPIIGITTRRLSSGGPDLDVVERAYADAVSTVGGVPRLLPRGSHALPEAGLSGVDGLLLSGGGDVDPNEYGMEPSEDVGGVDTARDVWEIGLVRDASDLGVPILGVCRGCQVLNVASGGTLIQHLPSRTRLCHLVAERRNVAHVVEIEPGSRLSAVAGGLSLGVNSIHHQAVRSLGVDLGATAWAPDGTIEAIEHRFRPAIGVQWHPENLLHDSTQIALFSWLIGQAKAGIRSGLVRRRGTKADARG
jgi:putative glutamine amidotransferase